MDALTTYRDDATYRQDGRNKDGLVATLNEIANRNPIRFSGRDEYLSSLQCGFTSSLSQMEQQNLDTPEAWDAHKLMQDMLPKIDAEVKQIKEDAESIERILSGHGYELKPISDGVNTTAIYVRRQMRTVDVVTDFDPYTQKWKLGYHHVPEERFEEWCDLVFDADNTWYRRAIDVPYRVRYSFGESLGGLALDAALAVIFAAAFMLGGDSLLAEASLFSIMGIRGVKRVAKSYHETWPEPQLTFAKTRVVDGKKALVYAIGDSKLK